MFDKRLAIHLEKMLRHPCGKISHSRTASSCEKNCLHSKKQYIKRHAPLSGSVSAGEKHLSPKRNLMTCDFRTNSLDCSRRSFLSAKPKSESESECESHYQSGE